MKCIRGHRWTLEISFPGNHDTVRGSMLDPYPRAGVIGVKSMELHRAHCLKEPWAWFNALAILKPLILEPGTLYFHLSLDPVSWVASLALCLTVIWIFLYRIINYTGSVIFFYTSNNPGTWESFLSFLFVFTVVISLRFWKKSASLGMVWMEKRVEAWN